MSERPEAASSRIPGGLSAVLIVKDEERDLPGALESLRGLVDETVIVVGAESVDRTEEIARASGAKVSVRRFDHYAGQKQAALDLATRRWVLSIDADERVTPGLRAEILRLLNAPDQAAAGYEIPFSIFFMGRRLRFGGLGSEKHLRLFRRERGRFVGGGLHEGIKVEGSVLRTRERIDHVPYRNLSEYLAKMDAYTTLAAQKRFAAGRRFSLGHHLLLPGEFFLRAVVKLGFLDGFPGLVWAGLSAFHSWLKYVKLRDLAKSS